jgi:homoserine kinase type II
MASSLPLFAAASRYAARVGTFTILDDDDVARIAAGFALGAVRSWRAIAAGTINSNFDVITDRGRWFIRVNEGKDEDDVIWEGALCAHLAARGAPVPVPLPTSSARHLVHRGLLVSAFAWIDGAHRAPHQVTADDARAVGAALATLHTAGDDFAGERRAGIYTWPKIRGRYDGFRGSADPALADAIALLGDELAWLEREAATRAAARRGVIHGDLFRDNVLWQGPALVAILDFEQASEGSFAYDLAVTINDWCWDPGPRLDVARALLDGYQRVRPLDAAERRALPVEVRAAAVRFTITRITDVYLPGVANLEKDFRAYLARVRAWRDGGLGPLATSV